MRLRTLSAFSMTLGILAATIGFTGPASAAPVSWTMPNVRGDILKLAVKKVQEDTGVPGLKFRIIDRRNGQDVHNQTNWEVCNQWPRAGQPISKKSKTVVLYVKRFMQKSCRS